MAAETSSSSRETRRGALFDDGDFAAEAAEDLCEFEADVAAADDDEVARQGVEFEDADVGEVGDFVDAGKVGDDGAAADVDEDLIGGEEIVVDADFFGGFEAGVAVEDGAVLACRADSLRGRRGS